MRRLGDAGGDHYAFECILFCKDLPRRNRDTRCSEGSQNAIDELFYPDAFRILQTSAGAETYPLSMKIWRSTAAALFWDCTDAP